MPSSGGGNSHGADGRFQPVPQAAAFDLPAAVERYRKGESIGELAAENRVTRRTIYNWLLAGLGDEKYRDVVTECLVARVADADEELEAARLSKDAVRVAAARETARFARMDLERRRPALYGPKQEVKHSGGSSNFTVVLLDRPTGGVKELDVTPVAALAAPEVAGLENKGETE